MTRQFTITRLQFEELQKVFNSYPKVKEINWIEQNSNGIGPTVELEFDPKATIKIDITDVSSW